MQKCHLSFYVIIIKNLASCFAKTKTTLFNVINYIKSYKILECVCVSVVTYETVELVPFLTTNELITIEKGFWNRFE